MKKKLIAAGAASLAVAAMPVVGVFAADPVTKPDTHTDILSVTIDEVCAFGYQTPEQTNKTINVTGVNRVGGDDGVGTWGTATQDTNGNTTATLSGTMLNGTYDDDFGSTTLGIYCNNENGYSITSAFVKADGTASDSNGALVSTTVSDTIPTTSTIAANATTGWSYKVESGQSGTATNVGQIQAGFSSWASTTGTIVSAPTKAQPSDSEPVKMTTNDGDYFKITYGVVIDQAQSAGTYTGGIKYTLAALN